MDSMVEEQPMPAPLPFLTRASAPTPWMDAAHEAIGTCAVAGTQDNPVVVAYYAAAGHPEIRHDDDAWCAAFVGAMLAQVDYPNTRALDARSYLQYGRKLDAPE